MIFITKQQLINIKLTFEELKELAIYLVRCNNEGFAGINRYHAHKERERMYQWHLYEVVLKVVKKQMTLGNVHSSKKTSLNFNEIELHTLSVMFKRVDCTPFMLQLQTRFTKKLFKLN